MENGRPLAGATMRVYKAFARDVTHDHPPVSGPPCRPAIGDPATNIAAVARNVDGNGSAGPSRPIRPVAVPPNGFGGPSTSPSIGPGTRFGSAPTSEPRAAVTSLGVRVRVPAKINLHLGVGPRRSDGFHELMTAFHAVALFDTVTLTPAPSMSVRVTGESAAEVPTDDRNLAWRAAEAVLGGAPGNPSVSIRIDKAIPVAAGLAGGSADGAAALIGADALSGHRRNRSELSALAAALGSDVAFALRGGTAIGTGRGEVLSPVLEVPERLYWVLALADGGLSTPAVYAEFDRRQAAGLDDGAGLTPPTELLRALRDGDPAAIGAALANDLQPAALTLAPHLQQTLDAGIALGALGSVIAGSGPTCVFLAPDADAASALARGLIRAGVCRTTRVAIGPAVGAQLC